MRTKIAMILAAAAFVASMARAQNGSDVDPAVGQARRLRVVSAAGGLEQDWQRLKSFIGTRTIIVQEVDSKGSPTKRTIDVESISVRIAEDLRKVRAAAGENMYGHASMSEDDMRTALNYLREGRGYFNQVHDVVMRKISPTEIMKAIQSAGIK